MQSVSKKNTSFLMAFLRNLGFIILGGVILLIVFPDLMREIFQIFGGLFGPTLVVIIIIVAALPRKRRR